MCDRDHAIDFDPLDGLLDRDLHRKNRNQFENLDSGELQSVSSGYSDSAIWPITPLHLGQHPVEQNVYPGLRNGEGEISPAIMEQLYVLHHSHH